jgi:hypothetical protein
MVAPQLTAPEFSASLQDVEPRTKRTCIQFNVALRLERWFSHPLSVAPLYHVEL